MRTLCISLCLAVCLIGCGRDLERSTGRVRLVVPAGPLPASFTAILRSQDGGIRRIDCPGAPADGLACTTDGITLDEVSGDVTVTIKASGFAFETRDVRGSELADQGRDDGGLSWVLRPLPEAVLNDDFATGLSVATGLVDFAALAYPSATDLGQALVVKFYIDDLAGVPTVYFQNTLRHPIHYDFVRTVLGKALTPGDFYRQTYTGLDRTAMAGSILFYPELATRSAFLGGVTTAPFVMTFFPSDDLTPEQARTAHRLIEERLGCAALSGGDHRLAYLPAGGQQEAAAGADGAEFLVRDAAWLVRAELYGNMTQQLLNPGIAYGTLRLLSPEALESTVVSYTDILLLTRLPNNLPVVGGTITEELQTPLAHVNVAARNRGTPNMALRDASTDPRIAPFLGRLVRFEIRDGGFTLAETTLAEAEAFWASRNGDPLVPDFDLERSGLPRFDDLAFADSLSVGVKAANLAELHRILPDATSDGFAVPFRYYHEFTLAAVVDVAGCETAQEACGSSGREGAACDGARQLCLSLADPPISLDGYLRATLEDASFRSDAGLRDAVLDGVRFHFLASSVDPAFGALLDARVAEVFGAARVKLRSSTNSEDLPNFSGAGLYSSFGAQAGGQEAASLVIRRTWASVWNRDAFEERAFWNIDHLAVKMGVAVNIAFTDEAANGVIITQNIADRTVAGMYANVQLGEVSVTNPEGGALPEVFSIVPDPAGGVQASILRYSSLSPGRPILTPDEILALYTVAEIAHEHFAGLYGIDPAVFALDMEFKLWGQPRRIFLKQARPYVQATSSK
ncbi:PEP/pyruvate-binding domain-containing protein [Myxococcota bacterium]|nr:PEP/pyruvate-binding domain-containing protein [Myxococcota bacterium]MBU1413720.1 PEP/pyruvate-binding domain-containing protein [Myxococcota bacterium]MBU1509038.1 PEP/pyruvate-binding domain-containing protein [Myxococcota bacterium]